MDPRIQAARAQDPDGLRAFTDEEIAAVLDDLEPGPRPDIQAARAQDPDGLGAYSDDEIAAVLDDWDVTSPVSSEGFSSPTAPVTRPPETVTPDPAVPEMTPEQLLAAAREGRGEGLGVPPIDTGFNWDRAGTNVSEFLLGWGRALTPELSADIINSQLGRPTYPGAVPIGAEPPGAIGLQDPMAMMQGGIPEGRAEPLPPVRPEDIQNMLTEWQADIDRARKEEPANPFLGGKTKDMGFFETILEALKNPAEAAKFGLVAGAESGVHTVASLPLLGTPEMVSLAGTRAYERAKNQGRAVPNTEDRVVGAVTGILEGFVGHKASRALLFGLPDWIKNKWLWGGAASGTLKGAGAEIPARALSEGVGEMAQEAIGTAGTHLGTEKDIPESTPGHLAQAGIAGLVFGGAMAGPAAGAEMTGKKWSTANREARQAAELEAALERVKDRALKGDPDALRYFDMLREKEAAEAGKTSTQDVSRPEAVTQPETKPEPQQGAVAPVDAGRQAEPQESADGQPEAQEDVGGIDTRRMELRQVFNENTGEMERRWVPVEDEASAGASDVSQPEAATQPETKPEPQPEAVGQPEPQEETKGESDAGEQEAAPGPRKGEWRWTVNKETGEPEVHFFPAEDGAGEGEQEQAPDDDLTPIGEERDVLSQRELSQRSKEFDERTPDHQAEVDATGWDYDWHGIMEGDRTGTDPLHRPLGFDIVSTDPESTAYRQTVGRAKYSLEDKGYVLFVRTPDGGLKELNPGRTYDIDLKAEDAFFEYAKKERPDWRIRQDPRKEWKAASRRLEAQERESAPDDGGGPRDKMWRASRRLAAARQGASKSKGGIRQKIASVLGLGPTSRRRPSVRRTRRPPTSQSQLWVIRRESQAKGQSDASRAVTTLVRADGRDIETAALHALTNLSRADKNEHEYGVALSYDNDGTVYLTATKGTPKSVSTYSVSGLPSVVFHTHPPWSSARVATGPSSTDLRITGKREGGAVISFDQSGYRFVSAFKHTEWGLRNENAQRVVRLAVERDLFVERMLEARKLKTKEAWERASRGSNLAWHALHRLGVIEYATSQDPLTDAERAEVEATVARIRETLDIWDRVERPPESAHDVNQLEGLAGVPAFLGNPAGGPGRRVSEKARRPGAAGRQDAESNRSRGRKKGSEGDAEGRGPLTDTEEDQERSPDADEERDRDAEEEARNEADARDTELVRQHLGDEVADRLEQVETASDMEARTLRAVRAMMGTLAEADAEGRRKDAKPAPDTAQGATDATEDAGQPSRLDTVRDAVNLIDGYERADTRRSMEKWLADEGHADTDAGQLAEMLYGRPEPEQRAVLHEVATALSRSGKPLDWTSTLREMPDPAQDYEGDVEERARARGGVGPKAAEPDKPGLARRIGRWLHMKLTDDLAGIANALTDIGARRPGDASERAIMTRGVTQIIEAAMKHGAPVLGKDGSIRFQGTGLLEIAKRLHSKRDGLQFTQFLLGDAIHNMDLGTHGDLPERMRKRDVSDNVAQAIEEINAWKRQIIRFAIDSGLVPARQQYMLDASFAFPLYQLLKESRDPSGIDWGTSKVGWRKPSLLGDRMIEIYARNSANLIELSVLNTARREVFDTLGMARKDFFTETTTHPTTALDEEVMAQQLAGLLTGMSEVLGQRTPAMPEKEEAAARRADAETLAREIVKKQRDRILAWQNIFSPQKAQGKRVIPVVRDGEITWYAAEDTPAASDLFVSLSLLKRPARATWRRALNAFRSFGQQTITISLNFMLRNVARDTVNAWAISKTGFVPFVSTLRGMRRLIRHARRPDPVVLDYLAAGSFGATMSADEDVTRKQLERALKRAGAKFSWRSVITSPARLLEKLEKVNWMFETASRLEEFARAREQGQSQVAAGFLARDFADYSKRGTAEWFNIMKDAIPFLNAGWVSLGRGLRASMKPGERGSFWVKMSVYMAISAAVYAATRDNPLVEDADEWERDAFHLIPLPKQSWFGAGRPSWKGMSREDALKYYEVIRIPKAWEVGSMASLAERTVDAVADGKFGKNLSEHFPRILLNNFKFGLVPTGLRTPLEAGKPWGREGGGLNRSIFTGVPIESAGMERDLPALRAGSYTSPTMRALGRKTLGWDTENQISPARMEHWVEGIFNAWGTAALATSDFIYNQVNQSEPAMDPRRAPGLKVFVSGKPGRTKYDTAFYDLYNEARTNAASRATVVERIAAGETIDPDDLRRIYRKAAVAPITGQGGRILRTLRKSEDQIRRSNLSPADKRERIDRLRVKRSQVAKQFASSESLQRVLE